MIREGKVSGPSFNRFLFKDAAFIFQALWRFGTIAAGGADFGEALTASDRIEDGDQEGWYDSWTAMANHVEGLAREYQASGHRVSARDAFFRATTYYRTAEIYLASSDPRVIATWQKGRDCFLEAAGLSGGTIELVQIPFEGTTLPAYWCRVDDSGKKRPLLIIQTGLDGTAEDLYFILAPHALKRGYNCLIFEGPGQGEVIRINKIPFRPNWETVLAPVVDFAFGLPEADPDTTALVAYSMGGYLAPRALAFDHRLKYCVVDGGVFNVAEGVLSKFPSTVGERIQDDSAIGELDRIVRQEMKAHPDLDKFIIQMLWTFQAESPVELLRMLTAYNLEGVIEKVQTEILVMGSIHDQVAGCYEQAKFFYQALKTTKTYIEFSDAEGGQFHCQSGAPMISSERLLNWLDDRLHP